VDTVRNTFSPSACNQLVRLSGSEWPLSQVRIGSNVNRRQVSSELCDYWKGNIFGFDSGVEESADDPSFLYDHPSVFL
jgi:hypothetical protein